MDFNFNNDQIKRREKYYAVCKELEKEKPANFVGLESAYSSDEGWRYHLHCAEEFGKRGWLSLGWPPEYGGEGDIMDRVLLGEARGYYGIPGVDVFGVGMLAPTLIAAATEEIKQQWLPLIASGRSMGCELWSEPDAGSDLAALNASARKQDDCYVLNGQKTWTTGAHRADWGFGVFKTDHEAGKHHDMTFLLIDMNSPGITVNPIQYMHGGHLYNDVFFDQVKIPAKNIVGKENEGWAIVNLLAGYERSNIDEIMVMVRHLEDMVSYCNEAKRNGVQLSKDPVIRNQLSEISCEIEAARALAYRVADLQNRNEMSLFDASAVKIFVSELGERFASLATDILGSFGQLKFSRWAPLEGLWERMYQECFVFSISMGTNEIQKNIISWYGLGLPRMK